jgi:hypothetical protein
MLRSRRPLFARPVAVSLLTFLTGCHLSRISSPALSMAAATLSAGGTSRDSSAHCIGGRKTEDPSILPGPNRAPKLISLHAYDADKMIMKLANQAVCNWPGRNSGDGRSAAIVLSKYEMACLNDLTVKSTQLKFAACNECAAFVDRGGNLWRQRQTWKGWKRLTLQRLASGFIKPSWAFHFSASRRP